MKKYRDTNPAFDYEIEASQVNQSTAVELSLLGDHGVSVEIDPETRDRTIGVNIPTATGVRRASEADGDWVVRNSKGEFFVLGDATFQQHYVEVDVVQPKTSIDLFHERGGKINGQG